MSHNQSDYNKQGMIWFVSSMAVSFAVMIYVAFLSGGVNLKEIPAEKSEGQQEQRSQDAAPSEEAKPGSSSDAKSAPDASSVAMWVSSEDAVARGQKLYAQNCSSCHGEKGEGDGPAGKNLPVKPRNLVEGRWQNGGGRLELYHVVSEGIDSTPMQAYKDILDSSERWSVVHYVRSITHNRVADSDAEVASRASALN